MNHVHEIPPTGLYAITPSDWRDAALTRAVEQALEGGAVMVQYRDKPGPRENLARQLLEICRHHHVPLIINDDVELARRIDADGVHLGRDDADPETARRQLGKPAIIGVSCYNELERATRLAALPVDYLAFGSVFASPTKPGAVPCPADVLTEARRLGKPVVAIGGLNIENAHRAIAAGADLLAVISDLFDAEDIQARARQYQQLFQRNTTP
jgi:thiamine-phosphate pyrophosphorylase